MDRNQLSQLWKRRTKANVGSVSIPDQRQGELICVIMEQGQWLIEVIDPGKCIVHMAHPLRLAGNGYVGERTISTYLAVGQPFEFVTEDRTVSTQRIVRLSKIILNQ